MKIYDKVICGSCRVNVEQSTNVFLCAKCLRSLPDEIRRGVMNAGGEEARAARRTALIALGATEVVEAQLAIPRGPRERKEDCGHKSYRFRQASILGGDDEVCDECGHVRYGMVTA